MTELLAMLKDDWDIIAPVLFLLIPACFYISGLVEGKKGLVFFILGIISHLGSILYRWYDLGIVPLTEKHDNISFMAFMVALIYLYFYVKRKIDGLAILVLPTICFFLFVSIMHRTVNTISPFMQSPWFFIHIFFFFTGYAFFILASCTGLFYLLRDRDDYEGLQYKMTMTGWCAYTIGLVAGSIWFFVAYGMYWLWTSKELWTTITWFYYGVYLHARYIKGLKGKPAAIIGILGLAVALFTYFGIGPGKIIQSPPTQF
jgi:ABC-type transport system involved in cytochrome c biogenesis permease subunit